LHDEGVGRDLSELAELLPIERLLDCLEQLRSTHVDPLSGIIIVSVCTALTGEESTCLAIGLMR
jgi:hypothetical protein